MESKIGFNDLKEGNYTLGDLILMEKRLDEINKLQELRDKRIFKTSEVSIVILNKKGVVSNFAENLIAEIE